MKLNRAFDAIGRASAKPALLALIPDLGRRHARRWRRHLGAGAVLLAMAALLAVPVIDLCRGGRVQPGFGWVLNVVAWQGEAFAPAGCPQYWDEWPELGRALIAHRAAPMWLLLGTAAALLLLLGVFRLSRAALARHARARLSLALSDRAIAIDIGLIPGDPAAGFAAYGDCFRSLARGNHRNSFEACGDLPASVIAPLRHLHGPLLAIHYVFVDRHTRQVTETDHNGQSRTRTETYYTRGDRHGVILGTPVRNLHLGPGSHYHRDWEAWDTASADFNRAFAVRTASQHAAARLLRPAFLLDLLDARSVLSDLSLEFNETGALCLLFSRPHLTRVRRRHDLREPDALAAELAEPARPESLDAVYAVLNALDRALT